MDTGRTRTVYFGVRHGKHLREGALYAQYPVGAKKEFIGALDSEQLERLQFLKCPAYLDEMNNVFSVPSQFDADFIIGDDYLESEKLKPSFFDDYITFHSPKDRLYGIKQNILMVAEDDDLEVSQMDAFMADNDYTRAIMTIPGKVNIGKYFRTLQHAFFVRKGFDRVHLKENEAMYYVKFHTNDKIKIVPFYWTEKIEYMARNIALTERAMHKWRPLKWYYDKMKATNFKKLLLKEIKDNLLG